MQQGANAELDEISAGTDIQCTCGGLNQKTFGTEITEDLGDRPVVLQSAGAQSCTG